MAAGNLGPGGFPSNGFNVKVTDLAPGSAYSVEWDQATTALQVNGPTITVPSNSPGMIDVYELTVIGGTSYYFYFGGGGLTFLCVFRSNGWTTTPFIMSTTSASFTAPASETYGVVVWRALPPDGYSLQVTDTPFLMGHEDTPGSAGGVAMGGPGSPNKSAADRGSSSATYAYVADGSGGLARIDVQNSRDPVFDLAIDMPGAVDLAVTANVAAVAASAGLHTVDLQQMQDRALVSFPTCTGVAPWGTHRVIVGKPQGVGAIGLVDWSQPMSPQLLLARDTGGDALRVVLSGPKVYVADGVAGLMTTDIEDFSDPGSTINHIALPGPALDVDCANDYVYVACGSAGLFVFDESIFAVVGSYDTAGEATGVTVSGNRVYVADGSLGLVVLDITNPASPSLVTTIDTAGNASGVAVVDGMVYLADGSNGLAIVAPEITATDTPDPDPTPVPATMPLAGLRAWPNPLTNRTTLEFSLAREQRVSIDVFDVAGRLVRRIFDGAKVAGPHSVAWDGRSDSGARVAAGVYTVRLERPDGEIRRRIVVLK